MKRLLLLIGLTAVLAGCGSTVDLNKNNVPVEDRTGTGVTDPNAGNTSGVGTSTVKSVDVDPAKGREVNNGPRIVYFDFDSFVIKPEYQSVVDTQARFIKSGKRHVVIEGHTDERGGREYNLALGQKRAEAVRRSLGLLGVADSQMEAVSFGKEKPAVPGSDETAMAKNRRAEISYR